MFPVMPITRQKCSRYLEILFEFSLHLEIFIYLFHGVSPNPRRCSTEHYGSVEPDFGDIGIGCSGKLF